MAFIASRLTALRPVTFSQHEVSLICLLGFSDSLITGVYFRNSQHNTIEEHVQMTIDSRIDQTTKIVVCVSSSHWLYQWQYNH